MEQETLKENVKDYIETRIDLIKLQTIDKAAGAVTSTVMGVATVILGLFMLVFLSFAAAFGIGEATGHTYIGFLAVTGFYLIVLFVARALKDKFITVPLINSMLKKFYSDDILFNDHLKNGEQKVKQKSA